MARSECESWSAAADRGTAVPAILYERGDEIVEQVVSGGASAHGVRGTLTVKGQTFDTLERLDGRVWLRPGTYAATFEVSPSGKQERGSDGKLRTRRQIRPSHSYKSFSSSGPAPILFHSGSVPSHFEGCIGAGVRSPGGISESAKTMDKIFDLLGGFKAGTAVTLEVRGGLPKKAQPVTFSRGCGFLP